MCLALDTGDDENDSQGQRSGKRYECNCGLLMLTWIFTNEPV